MSNLKAVDFFCSGGGMSYGLMQAGIDVIAGIDNDLTCKDTYEANIPNSKFIHKDIKAFMEEELWEEIDIWKNDKNLIFVGCSPCQFWTLLNTDKTKSKKSKNLLKDFERFVRFYNPGYVVVENVPGILSKKEESGFDEFVKNLKAQGYKYLEYDVINLNTFGVPQNRKRFTMIASRVTDNLIFPVPDQTNFPVVKDIIGEENGFQKIEAGNKDETDFMHTTSRLSATNLKRIKATSKDGGTRLDWANSDLQLETYKNRDEKSFKDTYGRMYWEKPAPTLTTKFYSLSNGRFGHPDEDRAISLREGASLQTFPKEYLFKSESIAATARIIGNAVPPAYAQRIGIAITEAQ